MLDSISGGRVVVRLGGCTAVNELESRSASHAPERAPDAYRDIWNLVASRQPRSWS